MAPPVYGFENASAGLAGHGFRRPALQAADLPAFVTLAAAQASCLGAYLVPAADGNVANGQTVLEDLSGKGGPAIQATLVSTGDWTIEASGGPGTGRFARCVKAPDGKRGESFFAAAASAFSSTPLSMIVVFKVETAQGSSQRVEIGTIGGTTGVPAADSTRNIWGNTNLQTEYGGYDTGIAHSDNATWLTFAIKHAAANSYGAGTVRWLSAVGSAFGGIGTQTGEGNAPNLLNGFRFARGRNGSPDTRDTANGIVKWAGLALFSGTLSSADLQALHESIG